MTFCVSQGKLASALYTWDGWIYKLSMWNLSEWSTKKCGTNI